MANASDAASATKMFAPFVRGTILSEDLDCTHSNDEFRENLRGLRREAEREHGHLDANHSAQPEDSTKRAKFAGQFCRVFQRVEQFCREHRLDRTSREYLPSA